MKTSIYPRECEVCNKVYQGKNSFYTHKRVGTCEKTQQKNTLINNNGTVRDINSIGRDQITSNSNNNIINFNLQGCPDMSKEEIQKLIKDTLNTQAMKEIKKILGDNQITTPKETITYLRKEGYAKQEIEAQFTIDNINVRDVQDKLMDEKLAKILADARNKDATHPLHVLFIRVFLTVEKGGELSLNNLKRRIIRNIDKGACEVVEKPTNGKKHWVRRRSDTVMAELLFLLGTRLTFAAFSGTDANLLKQEIETRNKLYGSMANSNHPFQMWWADIHSFEDLLIDNKAKKLIKTLKEEIVKDYEDGLVNGWHTLIECCSLLKTSKIIDKTNDKKSAKELKKQEQAMIQSEQNIQSKKNKTREDIISTL